MRYDDGLSKMAGGIGLLSGGVADISMRIKQYNFFCVAFYGINNNTIKSCICYNISIFILQ